MNKIHLKSAFLIASFALFLACQNNKSGEINSNTLTATAEKQMYKAVGVIKSVDRDASKLTIDHEDIAGYMSAMTMNFDVRDKNAVGNFKSGDKVDFELERTGEKIVITKITKIGEVAILNGGEIYKTNCAICHGASGEGAKKGISLIKGHARHHSEADFIKQVANGEDKKMPAFESKLSAEQIAEVVKFVRTELQKQTVKPEKHSHH